MPWTESLIISINSLVNVALLFTSLSACGITRTLTLISMKKQTIFIALGCATAGMLMVSCQNSKGLGSATPDGGYPFDESGNYIEGAADGGSGWTNTDTSVASVPEYQPTPEVSSNTGYTAVNDTIPTPEPTRSSYTTPEPTRSGYTPPAPTRSSASSSSYTVKRGDSLWGISRKYGTSVSSIQSANGLSGSEIRIGQTLSIPGGSGGGSAAVTPSTGGGTSASGSTHTVRSGETLWGISRKYGVSVSALKSANGMSGDTLSVGKTLRIP